MWVTEPRISARELSELLLSALWGAAIIRTFQIRFTFQIKWDENVLFSIELADTVTSLAAPRL